MTTPALAPSAAPARRVSLALDPLTHAELERAAGHRDVASYLYTLAGRYARWSELREWLTQLEAVYGPLPPEAIDRVHRQMLGLPRRADHPRTVSVAFSDSEFAALTTAAGDRPVAAYLRDLLGGLLADRPHSASTAPTDPDPSAAPPGAGPGGGCADGGCPDSAPVRPSGLAGPSGPASGGPHGTAAPGRPGSSG
ncbi:hypothetical protein LG943_08000 [Streptomonospora sp. S1-112]|uniref:Uncharacterized protein n=1 Tax=Streptomonospora mangrovi TaxID=2883123 RepID=A0A9X3SDV2_9ACTN|nr:hypothetical protein [Streptomonospora mangrovi]MDA0564267.1 hypothetical protein [Streptomonospora mangrovi]